MKKISLLAGIAALCLGGSACSSGDNTPGPVNDFNKIKSAKITVTVTGADNADYVSFVFAAGQTGDIWKVNGVVLENQQGGGYGADDFGSGKTFVIETVKPIVAFSTGLNLINYDGPITYSYKAEINGKVENEITNQVLSGDGTDVNLDFTYDGQ